MFFKRSDSVGSGSCDSSQIVKSGKNWLRAATSNFGLLKVIRGRVEETGWSERCEISERSRGLLKGSVAAAVLVPSVANTASRWVTGSERCDCIWAFQVKHCRTGVQSLGTTSTTRISVWINNSINNWVNYWDLNQQQNQLALLHLQVFQPLQAYLYLLSFVRRVKVQQLQESTVAAGSEAECEKHYNSSSWKIKLFWNQNI